MRRSSLFLLSALLVGCDRLAAVDELTDPVVAQGLYLGLDVPDAYQDDLAGAEGFEYAALCNVFLAFVANPSELADAPVEGATIHLRSPANGTLTFRDEGGGKYTLDSSDGLVYEVGEEPVITFEHEGRESRLTVLAPEAPAVALSGTMPRESAMEVDLSDYTFRNAVAAAYDLDRSKLTWDNLPTEVDEVYEFTRREEPIEEIELPAEAFMRKGNYVVGVAGMKVAESDALEGVNTSLSSFVAGRLTVGLVVVTE